MYTIHAVLLNFTLAFKPHVFVCRDPLLRFLRVGCENSPGDFLNYYQSRNSGAMLVGTNKGGSAGQWFLLAIHIRRTSEEAHCFSWGHEIYALPSSWALTRYFWLEHRLGDMELVPISWSGCATLQRKRNVAHFKCNFWSALAFKVWPALRRFIRWGGVRCAGLLTLQKLALTIQPSLTLLDLRWKRLISKPTEGFPSSWTIFRAFYFLTIYVPKINGHSGYWFPKACWVYTLLRNGAQFSSESIPGSAEPVW